MLLSVVLLLGITPWFGLHPQRGLSSAQSFDLIVVLDGGSSRLAAAERIRQRILHGDTQQGLSLPRFCGQCLESCFYTDPMKTNDHNECPFYATPLQR